MPAVLHLLRTSFSGHSRGFGIRDIAAAGWQGYHGILGLECQVQWEVLLHEALCGCMQASCANSSEDCTGEG